MNLMNNCLVCLVTMQAQMETPSDMHSNDKFLIQSVIASPGVTAKEVTHEMVLIPTVYLVDKPISGFLFLQSVFSFSPNATLQFSAGAGKQVEQTMLRVTYSGIGTLKSCICL